MFKLVKQLINKKLTLIRYLFIAAAVLLFYNCEEDYYNRTNVAATGKTTHRILTGNEALRKKEALVEQLRKDGGKGLNKLRGTMAQNAYKSGKPLDIGLPIDKSEIYEIKQKNGNVNYTYRINHPDAGMLKFYNILEKSSPAGTKTELIEYSMQPEFAQNYYAGRIGFERFSGTVTMGTIIANGGFPCDDTPTVPAPVLGGIGNGAGNPGGGTPAAPPGTGTTTPGWGTGNGNNPGAGGTNGFQALVNAQYEAMQIHGETRNNTDNSGSDDDNDGGDGDAGEPDPLEHYHNYYFRTAPIPPDLINPSDPCSDGQEVGILEPNIVSDEDNCEALMALLNNTNIKASFNTLRTKIAETREYGYKFEGTQNPVALSLANGSDNELSVPSGGLIWGASHTHPNPDLTEFVPMFSLSDIYKLGQIAVKYNNPGVVKKYNKFVFTLTVNQGGAPQTFAIKIDNWIKFSSFCTEYFNKTDEERRAAATILKTKYTRVPKIEGTTGLLKVLFKYMSENRIKGLSVYKAKENLEGWDKLTYDQVGNDIAETPCNL